jgi:hypothetical protein
MHYRWRGLGAVKVYDWLKKVALSMVYGHNWTLYNYLITET